MKRRYFKTKRQRRFISQRKIGNTLPNFILSFVALIIIGVVFYTGVSIFKNSIFYFDEEKYNYYRSISESRKSKVTPEELVSQMQWKVLPPAETIPTIPVGEIVVIGGNK